MRPGVMLARCLAALCVLGGTVLHTSAVSTFFNGVTYTEYTGPLSWDDANIQCNPNLAVFDDVEAYKHVINWLRGFKAPEYTLHYGIVSASGDPHARTVGERIPEFTNFFASGANVTDRRCARIQLDPDGEQFLFHSVMLMGDCDDDLPYLCMSEADARCSKEEDLCPADGDINGYQRSLNDYCLWEAPPHPLTKGDAEDFCKKNGGGIIAIYQGDLTTFQNRFYNTSFNKYQPWNAVWTSEQQAPGEGYIRFPSGYVSTDYLWGQPSAYNYELLNILVEVPSEMMFVSSLSASGWTVVFYPYFETKSVHNDAAWSLVDIFFIEYLTGGTRQPLHAYTVCEALEDDFYLFNAYKVPNAHVELDAGRDTLVYTCWANYTFSDGWTRKEHRGDCNLDELHDLNAVTKAGCIPKDLCVPNPCDHYCVSSLSYLRGFTCSCYSGYRLADDGLKCVDIDECDEYSDICGLGESGACRNRPGTHDCYCYTGYSYSKTGKCEASSPFTSGTIELSFRLPSCAGDYADPDNKKALAEAVYDIAENQIFMSRVTVGEVTISPLGTMTVVLNIGGVSTLFDHSVISYRYEQMLSKTGLSLPSGKCKVIAGVYYSSAGIAKAIQVKDTCSLYNGVSFCAEDSECDPQDDGPICVCDEGYTGLRCDTPIEEPLPSGVTTIEVALIAVVSVLACLLVVVIVLVCYLWSAQSNARLVGVRRTVVDPTYGSKPPIGPPRSRFKPWNPWYQRRFGSRPPGFPDGPLRSSQPPALPGLPQAWRPSDRGPTYERPQDVLRRREEFRKGFPIG